MNWLVLLSNVTLLNLILSGDNALAISMAASRLPKQLRQKAVIIGSTIAILARVGFVILGVYIIKLPLVKTLAALILIFIAIKLTKDQLLPTAETKSSHISEHSGLYKAIGLIVVADVGMSLDNALAIVAVANGRISVLFVGLLISMPVLVVASQIIANIIDKLSWITYVAAAYISWIAGVMFAEDPVMQHISWGSTLRWVAPAGFCVLFLATFTGLVLRLKQQNAKKADTKVQLR